jgi:predicted butyrate kinase (DUF1464 family)
MTRVVGIDPGTVSIDVCGLADGRLYLDRSWPTPEALARPDEFLASLTDPGGPDLVVGPSGYGLPMLGSTEVTEDDLRLAFLAPPDEVGGIGGLRKLTRQIAASGLNMVYTPGVIHLDTVPDHRKLNRVDIGTADKVCAAALGIDEECRRLDRAPDEVSFIMLELGGAFTAAVAVERGQIVDGMGGTSGTIGWRSAGALDGEVAYLAGQISKAALFQGGVSTLLQRGPDWATKAIEAYIEGAVKAVRQLCCSASSAGAILLSGRHSRTSGMFDRLAEQLSDIGPLRQLTGFARIAKQGAQGAALVADGLAGGRHQALVERLRLRQAQGSVLDHLIFISPETARLRLGMSNA